MDSPVQQIKDKLDIAEFIRSYVPLQPAGKNFKANCPFHREKTPSFIVSPERQTWHCFGACSEGGDIFKFLMKHENIEFYEALKILAEKAGIELKKTGVQEYRQFGVLYEINETAKEFFKKQLAASEKVFNYLKSRGLKKETIDEFELGLGSSSYDNLTVHLIKAGYNVKDIERAGLNFKTERGSYVDRFRGRIMFPIFNHFGKVVGFSGRILPELDSGETGKYINSPETPIFLKSKILYGFHKAKNSAREKKSAVLVEGQMDFLMSWQDGLKNAVATSGTALTAEHLKLLRRYVDELVLCFDSDEAGLNAAEKSIDLAHAEDFSVKILSLGNYKDPAEAALKEPGFMEKADANAETAMEFYFSRYLRSDKEREAGGTGGFKNNIRIILGKIKNLASAVERFHWLKKAAELTGVREEALIEEMNKLGKAGAAIRKTAEIKNHPASNNRQLSRRELISERFAVLLAADGNLEKEFEGYLNYFPDSYRSLIESFILKKEPEGEFLKNLFNFISLRSAAGPAISGEQAAAECRELLKQLKSEYLKEIKGKLSADLRAAEKEGNEEKIAAILKEFDKISKLGHN